MDVRVFGVFGDAFTAVDGVSLLRTKIARPTTHAAKRARCRRRRTTDQISECTPCGVPFEQAHVYVSILSLCVVRVAAYALALAVRVAHCPTATLLLARVHTGAHS